MRWSEWEQGQGIWGIWYICTIISSIFKHYTYKLPLTSFEVIYIHLTQDNSTTSSASSISSLLIPSEYADFTDVFSKESVDTLPEYKPWNHTIPLMEGKQPPYGPIHSMSKLELTSLWEYLKENLAKSFICLLTSSTGSLILFVKKENSSLRLCIDYRGLNTITIKNRYSLLLIPEMLNRLRSASKFTKLNLRSIYNRIHINSD